MSSAESGLWQMSVTPEVAAQLAGLGNETRRHIMSPVIKSLPVLWGALVFGTSDQGLAAAVVIATLMAVGVLVVAAVFAQRENVKIARERVVFRERGIFLTSGVRAWLSGDASKRSIVTSGGRAQLGWLNDEGSWSRLKSAATWRLTLEIDYTPRGQLLSACGPEGHQFLSSGYVPPDASAFSATSQTALLDAIRQVRDPLGPLALVGAGIVFALASVLVLVIGSTSPGPISAVWTILFIGSMVGFVGFTGAAIVSAIRRAVGSVAARLGAGAR